MNFAASTVHAVCTDSGTALSNRAYMSLYISPDKRSSKRSLTCFSLKLHSLLWCSTDWNCALVSSVFSLPSMPVGCASVMAPARTRCAILSASSWVVGGADCFLHGRRCAPPPAC